MPITIDCPQCNRRYSLADEMAGKQAQCPCGNLLLVAAPASDDKGRAEPLWRVWTADGKVHGPVSKQLLDQAVMAGRLNASAHIIRDDWTSWRAIGSEYPHLQSADPNLNAAAQYAPTSPAGIVAAGHLPPGDFCQRCRSPKSPWATHCPRCGCEDAQARANQAGGKKAAFWRAYDSLWQ